MRFPAVVLPAFALIATLHWTPTPARALDCRQEAETELQRLGLTKDAVVGVSYVEKHNPTDKGPEFLGVRSWVRLKACSGYLVIDMTRSCFVRQSYTRGDCRVEGATAY